MQIFPYGRKTQGVLQQECPEVKRVTSSGPPSMADASRRVACTRGGSNKSAHLGPGVALLAAAASAGVGAAA